MDGERGDWEFLLIPSTDRREEKHEWLPAHRVQTEG